MKMTLGEWTLSKIDGASIFAVTCANVHVADIIRECGNCHHYSIDGQGHFHDVASAFAFIRERCA